jgi:hypothetical protein
MEEVSIDEMIPGKRYYIKGIYHPPTDEPDAPDMFKGTRTQTGVFQEKTVMWVHMDKVNMLNLVI